MGLEPTTLGTTIQCSNQLSYIHHVFLFLRRCKGRDYFLLCKYFVDFFCIINHSSLIYYSPKSAFPEPKSICPVGNRLNGVTQINIKQLNCAPE